MADRRGALLITGGGGTVGTALLPRLACLFNRVVAVGRRRPGGLRAADGFVRADFMVAEQIEGACEQITEPVAGVVLAAGVDSRQGLPDLSVAEFEMCMRVNSVAGLWVLSAAVGRSVVAPLPVVVMSSDVVGGRVVGGTVAYAASKAALEESVRHAMADAPVGLAVLLARLPDLRVPMEQVDGTRPAPDPTGRSVVLDAAVDRVAKFLADPPRAAGAEMWPGA